MYGTQQLDVILSDSQLNKIKKLVPGIGTGYRVGYDANISTSTKNIPFGDSFEKAVMWETYKLRKELIDNGVWDSSAVGHMKPYIKAFISGVKEHVISERAATKSKVVMPVGDNIKNGIYEIHLKNVPAPYLSSNGEFICTPDIGKLTVAGSNKQVPMMATMKIYVPVLIYDIGKSDQYSAKFSYKFQKNE